MSDNIIFFIKLFEAFNIIPLINQKYDDEILKKYLSEQLNVVYIDNPNPNSNYNKLINIIFNNINKKKDDIDKLKKCIDNNNCNELYEIIDNKLKLKKQIKKNIKFFFENKGKINNNKFIKYIIEYFKRLRIIRESKITKKLRKINYDIYLNLYLSIKSYIKKYIEKNILNHYNKNDYYDIIKIIDYKKFEFFIEDKDIRIYELIRVIVDLEKNNEKNDDINNIINNILNNILEYINNNDKNIEIFNGLSVFINDFINKHKKSLINEIENNSSIRMEIKNKIDELMKEISIKINNILENYIYNIFYEKYKKDNKIKDELMNIIFEYEIGNFINEIKNIITILGYEEKDKKNQNENIKILENLFKSRREIIKDDESDDDDDEWTY